jgi:hypothetical protein
MFGGGGIGNIEKFRGRGTAPLAADVVLQLGDLGCYCTAHESLLGILIGKKLPVW